MSASATPDDVRAEVRAEVRRWIAANWDGHRPLVEWRERLVDARWARPSWDERWLGRGLPAWSDAVVSEELARAGAVGTPVSITTAIASSTILAHGPDEQRERYLRPLLTGAERWCQLFSEPGAGSDLAGVTATATREGDEWVVEGTKVWTSGARRADFALLLVRTDWDVPKHQGLSVLALPMHQANVSVRPLLQMNGYASFDAVVLDGARVPLRSLVGDLGGGWSVVQTVLANERRLGALSEPASPAGEGAGLDDARREVEEYAAVYRWYPQRTGRTDLAVQHARDRGRSTDPIVRQDLARLLTAQRLHRWTVERHRAIGATGPYGSLGKLALSGIARQAAALHARLGGAASTLTGSGAGAGAAAGAAAIAEIVLSVPAQSIAGGTDEVQRNIIGERLLGLPRDLQQPSDVPFRTLPRNT